jgi:hypothetical protein
MKAESARDILALYDEGTVTHGEMLAMLLRLVTFENGDQLIAGLPADIRDDFVIWARQRYGGERVNEDAIHIGGEGYEQPPEDTVRAMRYWLSRHPE